MHSKRNVSWKRLLIGVLLSPVVLIGLSIVLLYCPPIQRWAVSKASEKLQEEMGLSVTVGDVHLTPFCDLQLGSVLATDAEGDTIVDTRSMQLDVAFLPLFDQQINVEALELRDAKLDTKNFVSDLRLSGRVHRLSALSRGVAWKREALRLNHALLEGASLNVALSDTAAEKPDTAPNRWNIVVDRLLVKQSGVALTLPGDTTHVRLRCEEASLAKGAFDLGKKDYRVGQFTMRDAACTMNQCRESLPKSALFDIKKLNCHIDSLHFDRQKSLRLVLRSLALREQKHKLALSTLRGNLYLDSTRVESPNLWLQTPTSSVGARLSMDFTAVDKTPRGLLQLTLKGRISHDDLTSALGVAMVPSDFATAAQQLRFASRHFPAQVEVDVRGNLRHLMLRRFDLTLPGLLSFYAEGAVRDATLAQRSGALRYHVQAQQLSSLESFLPSSVRSQLQLPNTLSLSGTIGFHRADYRTHFVLSHRRGNLRGQAQVNLLSEAYEASIDLRNFPLADFVKHQPLSPFSGKIGAKGKGFDPTTIPSQLVATARIDRFDYAHYPLDGISLDARMRDGNLLSNLRIENALISGGARVVASLRKRYEASVSGEFSKIDLRRLGVTPDTLTAGGNLALSLSTDKNLRNLRAQVDLSALRLLGTDRAVSFQSIAATLRSATDSTQLALTAGDLNLSAAARGNWQRLGSQVQQLQKAIARQFAQRHLDQSALKRLLPTATLHFSAASNNPLASYLRFQHVQLSQLSFRLASDPRSGLNGSAQLGQIRRGTLQIDTTFAHLVHSNDGLSLTATVRNDSRRNAQPFTATLRSQLFERGVSAELSFADKVGDLGLQLGARATLERGGVNVQLYPQNPIIAYRRFSINADNFLWLDARRKLRSNIDLLADDGTQLKLFAAESDTLGNDLHLDVRQLNLGELSSAIPYLPPMSGTLAATVNLRQNGDSLVAQGDVEARNFAYEGTTLGTLGATFDYAPRNSGEQALAAQISVDGKAAANAHGSYRPQSSDAIDGTIELTEFPLALADAFIREHGFAMKGTLRGNVSVGGTLSSPKVEGDLTAVDGHLQSEIYGLDFALDTKPILIRDSEILFDEYLVRTTGSNQLRVNGSVDLSEPTDPYVNFYLQAANFRLIDAKRQSRSALYGKVDANFDCSLRGTPSELQLRGALDVLPTTDCTYLLTNSPLTVTDELEGLVAFRNFADTLSETQAQRVVSSGGIDMVIGINVRNGAHINCQLSNNGDSYVDVYGSGSLIMRMTPRGETRLTGRLTVDEGEMNYELPVIPLRKFTLAQGSYVEFKGDMLNPTLAITATDKVRAVVTENDQQRSVTFTSGIKISRTLEDMGLEFTIEAPEDLAIQNSLTAMSPEGRNKAAIALMATGMYITDDNLSAGGIKASNALNAFLQNEIQNLAGKALSTVDLSFGMENGTSTTGQTTTDYSFQFSKRFLNNRMRIVIGGKVSTGADATNTTESFIDNVALEYRLDNSSSRYVRIFYDRDSQDALEGRLMKTGAGIVLRRKSDSLGELFLFRRRKSAQP